MALFPINLESCNKLYQKIYQIEVNAVQFCGEYYKTDLPFIGSLQYNPNLLELLVFFLIQNKDKDGLALVFTFLSKNCLPLKFPYLDDTNRDWVTRWICKHIHKLSEYLNTNQENDSKLNKMMMMNLKPCATTSCHLYQLIYQIEISAASRDGEYSINEIYSINSLKKMSFFIGSNLHELIQQKNEEILTTIFTFLIKNKITFSFPRYILPDEFNWFGQFALQYLNTLHCCILQIKRRKGNNDFIYYLKS